MPITAADIKLLASARMVDADDGGGQMTGTGLQDGLENNVFPDVSNTDRAFGKLALRKVYPAVLNAGTDTLLGAHVILEDMPDDAAVRAFAFLGTGANESRADALVRLEASHWEAGGATGLEWAKTPHSMTRLKSNAGVTPLSVGSVVMAGVDAGEAPVPVLITGLTEILEADGTFGEGFTAGVAGDRVFAVTYDGTPGTMPATPTWPTSLAVPSTTTPRLAGTRPVTGTLSIGDTFCDVDTLLASVVPKVIGSPAGSALQIGIDAATVLPGGVAAAFRAGDGLVIHHTDEVEADTYANTNTIDCGRTGLANVRLIGDDGVSIPSGWTVNLATGVVTVNDITGWDQPVRVQHTIEEVLACARTGYPERSGGSAGSSTSQATAPFVLTHGLTMYCGRPNVGRIRVISRTGQDITDLTYGVASQFRYLNVDLAAGVVYFSDGGGTPGAFATSHSPVTLVSSGTFAVLSAATAPQATLNRITFNRPLTKAFPAGTLISSMLLLGDLQSRVGAAFAQETWGNIWADARIGSSIVPQYQQVSNPIAVSNRGAISERWAIIFTSPTTFRVVGETVGQIVSNGDINSNLSPPNPAAGGQPYFTLLAAGWGTGWAAGNVLRFNTGGANAPIWVARAVLPSAPNTTPDSLTVAVRGDIDA